MSSIISYPERGHWGKSNYRGNCSGHVYKDLYQATRPNFVVDPCVGGGTSVEVAHDMGIEAIGLDLHSGFNLLSDSILSAAGKPSDLCVSHFPYYDMIVYGGNVHQVIHPDDLSRCESVDDFIEKCHLALLNQREAVRPGGYYATLIGDLRRQGKYYSFQSDFIARMPADELRSVIIKAQHNCWSDGQNYQGRFNKGLPRIMHEYLIVWQRPEGGVSLLVTLGKMARKAHDQLWSTWKTVVRHAMIQLGGQADLKTLYEAIEGFADSRIAGNQNWQAKVRQTLQRAGCFQPVERGIWKLAS